MFRFAGGKTPPELSVRIYRRNPGGQSRWHCAARAARQFRTDYEEIFGPALPQGMVPDRVISTENRLRVIEATHDEAKPVADRAFDAAPFRVEMQRNHAVGIDRQEVSQARLQPLGCYRSVYEWRDGG